MRPLALLLLNLSLVIACDRSGDKGVVSTIDASTGDATTERLRVTVSPTLLESGRIQTSRVERRAPTGSLRLPGDVIATAEGAAEAGSLLSGRIARFEVREGDRVRASQVLAWIDAPEAARAVADLLRARTRTETHARKVQRLEGLVVSEAATHIALDEARLELDLARADLAAAKTLLASLGLPEPPALTKYDGGGAIAVPARLPVRSPVDGVVVERMRPLGAHVTPDTHIFRLVSEGRSLVEARLADGGGFVIGPVTTPNAIIEPRGGKKCEGRVLGTLPEVDAQTRTRRVRIAPEPSCVGLVVGGHVDVDIQLPRGKDDAGTPRVDDALVVPAASVIDLRTAKIVFVKGHTAGEFFVRPVEPGPRTGDDLVIRAGLEEGEEIVSVGAVLLKGELVRSELEGQ